MQLTQQHPRAGSEPLSRAFVRKELVTLRCQSREIYRRSVGEGYCRMARVPVPTSPAPSACQQQLNQPSKRDPSFPSAISHALEGTRSIFSHNDFRPGHQQVKWDCAALSPCPPIEKLNTAA